MVALSFVKLCNQIHMRTLGFLLLVVALLGLVLALAMDTTVATDDISRRVHNVGLMRRQENVLLIMLATFLASVLLISLGGRRSSPSDTEGLRKCPYCAEAVQISAIKCKHCGGDIEAQAAPAVQPSKPEEVPSSLKREEMVALVGLALATTFFFAYKFWL